MYQTYVKTDGKRKLIRRATREKLEAFLVDYYSDQGQDRTTLRAVFDRWIVDRASLRSPGTVDRDRWIWDTFFSNADLAGQSVKSFRRAPLQAAVMQISDAHGLTRRQYNGLKSLLNAVLDFAVDEEIIPVNPARAFSRVSSDRFADPPRRDVKEKVFTGQEAQRIVDHCYTMYDKTGNPSYLGIVLNFYLGLRVGELVSLRFSDFDREEMTLTVCRSERLLGKDDPARGVNRYTVRDGLKKGHDRREIGIDGCVLEIVDTIRAGYEKRHLLTDWLLVDGNGNRKSKKAVDCTMSRVNRALHLPARSIHSIRKTLLTGLIASRKFSLREVQEIAGHTDPTTTLKFYAADIADRKEQGRRVSSVVGIQRHSKSG